MNDFQIDIFHANRRYMWRVMWHSVVIHQTSWDYDSELAAIQAAEEYRNMHRLNSL